MSASSSTTNLKLPVFSDDDIPSWLGDWNNTVKTIDSIVGFKKVFVNKDSNLSGNISCTYNKVLKLMEYRGKLIQKAGHLVT